MKRVTIALLMSVGFALLLARAPGLFDARVHAQTVAPAHTNFLHTREWYQQHSAGQGGEGGVNSAARPFSPTDNLPPGNGDIMPAVHVYFIFWTPNNTIAASYKSLLARFVNDLGNTPFLNIVTQYPANNGTPVNTIDLAGNFTDTTHAYPHAGTGADPLTDGDIRGEVDAAIAANGWPNGGITNFFAVFTEQGIESCFGSDCTPGTPNSAYCAYHFNFTNGGERIYTNMPFVNTWGGSCNNTDGTPNDTDADREISTFSHELFEAITDPRPNDTWTDGNCGGGVACGEIGDKCAYFFPNAPNGNGSNLTLHGNPYNVQPEWSNGTFTALGGNANDGCTHAFQPADLDISKAGPATVFAGGNFDYSIHVQSNSSPTAETPHFTDNLNGSLQFQTITPEPGWSCSTPAVGTSGSIDCKRLNGSLANEGFMNSGDTANFNVTSRVSPSAVGGTSISNTGRITWDGQYAPNNDTAANVHLSETSMTSALVVTSADLSISKSTQGAAVAGQDFSYTIDVENAGPSDAQAIVMTDTLPAGTTFVSVTGSGGFICGGVGPVVCTKATLGAGAIVTFTLTVHIPANVANATVITNTASVASTTADPNPGNNTASVPATVSAEADLSISKTGPAAPIAGTNVLYQITGANLGPSDAQTVAVTDNTPAGTTFVSFTSPGGWVNVTPAVGGTGLITSSRPTLAAGATPPFSLTVHLGAAVPAGTQLCNTANIATTTLDPVPGNNSSQTCGTVQTSADLSVTQTASKTGSPGHGTVTFVLTVMNNGPSDSQNITLVANSALFTGPSPAINVTNGGTCSVGVQTVTCTWPSLALGAHDVVSISVPYRSAVGSVCDSATLSSGTPDPNSINNNVTSCISKK